MTAEQEFVGGESTSSFNKMSGSGFVNHVFNFDETSKSNMTNMCQYILLGLIPIVVVLKLIKTYIPEDDDNKGTFELTFEVVLQLFSIFFAIYFIDRIVRYIPTYSGLDYHKFNEINFILPILIILVTMQTKLGAKINIIYDRGCDMWNGNSSNIPLTNGNNVRVSQPILNQHQNSRADGLDNTIIPPQAGQMPQQNNVSMIDALPNMVQQNNNGGGLNTFQQQAIQNSFMDSMEPMAANGALGGSFGTSF